MTDFKWEADALVRAKKLYAQGHDMTVNSLEGACKRRPNTTNQTNKTPTRLASISNRSPPPPPPQTLNQPAQ